MGEPQGGGWPAGLRCGGGLSAEGQARAGRYAISSEGSMTAVAMLQALLFGFLLAAMPAAGEDLEERLWDLHIVTLDAEPAPAFTLASLAGEMVSLSDWRGRAVLLYFWATWRALCARELPSTMEQVHK